MSLIKFRSAVGKCLLPASDAILFDLVRFIANSVTSANLSGARYLLNEVTERGSLSKFQFVFRILSMPLPNPSKTYALQPF